MSTQMRGGFVAYDTQIKHAALYMYCTLGIPLPEIRKALQTPKLSLRSLLRWKALHQETGCVVRDRSSYL